MLKRILLPLLFLPLVVACEKKEPPAFGLDKTRLIPRTLKEKSLIRSLSW